MYTYIHTFIHTPIGRAPFKNQGPIKNPFGFLPVKMSSQDVGS